VKSPIVITVVAVRLTLIEIAHGLTQGSGRSTDFVALPPMTVFRSALIVVITIERP